MSVSLPLDARNKNTANHVHMLTHTAERVCASVLRQKRAASTHQHHVWGDIGLHRSSYNAG